MGRYRATRRRRAKLVTGAVLALAALGAFHLYRTHLAAVPASEAPAGPAARSIPAAVAELPAEPDPRRLELQEAWQASALPEPPAGWLDAYAAVAAAPCARLELEGGSATLHGRVTAASADIAARLKAVALAVAGVATVEHDMVAPDSPVCGLLDLLNGGSLPSPTVLARLERPADGRCATPPCYGGLAQQRLREGERLVVSVVGPPVASHLTVELLEPGGTVVHLYPRAAVVDAQPAALAAGDTIWIGDARAGAAFTARTVGPPLGRSAILVLASPNPLLPEDRPASEPLAAFLSRLRQALAAQAGPARPLASLLVFETVPAAP
jgi:hypothetical protein